ncbi:hypothetical protein [Lactobacillus xylocopicola]|uniref:Transposase n=1 Tax=Lactobacillus xylocopicola TaxID=2976676 RepID=A0ABM8BGE6_9LACO|nr:hypothetical protein [Lactobacillus xylocopicola]BDR60341.1 hypothetical protein KIM322_06020 [Lactobacillus xylocopicola]
METVRVFLKHDLGIFAIRSGRRKTDLLADKVDHLTTVNVERTTENIAFAENVTWCVGKAIQACSIKSRKILTGVYLLDQLNKTVMKEIGYGQSRYWELKQIALDEFMENFAAYQKEIGLEPYIKLVK